MSAYIPNPEWKKHRKEVGVSLLDIVQSEMLDSILIKDGDIIPREAETIKNFSLESIAIWCHKNGIFQVITTELIEWLAKEIDGYNTIEIAAGQGIIGRELGIPSTDSRIWESEGLAEYKRDLQDQTIANVLPLPKRVETFEASEAIKHYNPQCVIASWGVQYGTNPNKKTSMYGIKYDQVLNSVKKLIWIGNTRSLQTPLVQLPPKKYKFPWLVSRSRFPSFNAILIYEKKLQK